MVQCFYPQFYRRNDHDDDDGDDNDDDAGDGDGVKEEIEAAANE